MGAAAIAGIGLQAAGGAFNAYGSITAGNANQRMAEREADVLDYRANLAVENGTFSAQQARKQGKAVEGAQKTGYASQGVVVGDGSSGQVLEQTAKLSEQDALQVKLNAAREAWGFREQAKQTRYQGDLAKFKGRMDAIGGILGTGGSLAASSAGLKNSGSVSTKTSPSYESSGQSIYPMKGKPKGFLDTYNSLGGKP